MKIKRYLIAAGYTMILAACTSSPLVEDSVNLKASLPPEFHFSQKEFKVISMIINKTKGTMSTLYGNNVAIVSAKAGTQNHAKGLVMALITWRQKPNPYWFGNNIPGQLLSVEMITADKATGNITYALFEGKGLTFNRNIPDRAQRVSFILNPKPSIMP